MKSYDYLISYNIKPSVQRIAIMDYLLAHKTHPSIDEIYLALCKDIPTLSKTTVLMKERYHSVPLFFFGNVPIYTKYFDMSYIKPYNRQG